MKTILLIEEVEKYYFAVLSEYEWQKFWNTGKFEGVANNNNIPIY